MQLTKDKLDLIVANVTSSMTAERPLNFLKRCCEIIVRIYGYLKASAELVSIIQVMAGVGSHCMKLALMYFI
jgi:hypothetical protein